MTFSLQVLASLMLERLGAREDLYMLLVIVLALIFGLYNLIPTPPPSWPPLCSSARRVPPNGHATSISSRYPNATLRSTLEGCSATAT